MKILLLYNGYPRLSQCYQYDEAIELAKNHEILIISWAWPVYVAEENVPPCVSGIPLSPTLMKRIKNFQPDSVHVHFLSNVPLVHRLAHQLRIPFTVRTHSFDILECPNSKKNKIELRIRQLQKYITYIKSDYCRGMYVFHPFRQWCIDAGYPSDKLWGCWPTINVTPFRNVFSLPHGDDIMSGGAVLPKKNITGFIDLAKEIKNMYPSRMIRYYSVQEDPVYANQIYQYNASKGYPVEFCTVQHSQMPAEYKKHQWLIYTCCPQLGTVGYPLMVAEAQASGVGVIMYRLRDDMADYVTNNGYLYDEHREVLAIISNGFDPVKRQAAYEQSSRYDINGFDLPIP